MVYIFIDTFSLESIYWVNKNDLYGVSTSKLTSHQNVQWATYIVPMYYIQYEK